MFRKLVLAAGAAAVVGAAALTPTAASAHMHGHHHHWHGGFGWYAPTYISAPDCYVVKKVVMTDNGPRVRRVTVCD